VLWHFTTATDEELISLTLRLQDELDALANQQAGFQFQFIQRLDQIVVSARPALPLACHLSCPCRKQC
jgi:hypothetical protein